MPEGCTFGVRKMRDSCLMASVFSEKQEAKSSTKRLGMGEIEKKIIKNNMACITLQLTKNFQSPLMTAQ